MDSGEPEDQSEGPVLEPDELEISEDENVLEIDEGRFVISTGDKPPDPSTSPDEVDSEGTHSDGEEEPEPEIAETDVHTFLSEYFESTETSYGFDVTAKFDNSVQQHRLVSNNVVTVFEGLILWYAEQIGGDTPIEEVLGILLTETNVPIRYPRRTLVALLEHHGLGRTDSIDELLGAIEDSEGVLLPPSERRRK